MTKKPVLMLTHVTARDAGEIAVILGQMDHPVETLRLNKGDALPANIADYAGFVSFGGPASANDEHIDYIHAELEWMPGVMALDIPLLGVCLGSQILARSLGARVHRDEMLVEYGDRTTRIEAHPIGIEFDHFQRMAQVAPHGNDNGVS